MIPASTLSSSGKDKEGEGDEGRHNDGLGSLSFLKSNAIMLYIQG